MFWLIILGFFQHIPWVYPLPLIIGGTALTPPVSIESFAFCVEQRTILDIIWSCIVTIFACSWVSVHPNMPKPHEHWFKVNMRRVEVLLWAIVAPEMILYWATRQWYGAKKLTQKYKDKDWTMTHGYFIQMGGFILYDGSTPKEVLTAEHMENLLAEGRIAFPEIHEDEIKDRSKGDGLSKFLVILQTSWFVAQCITRKAEGLITTELELVTLAFAVLNGAMYFLWWKKPLNVAMAIAIPLLESPAKNETVVTETVVDELPFNADAKNTASKEKLAERTGSTIDPNLTNQDQSDAESDYTFWEAFFAILVFLFCIPFGVIFGTIFERVSDMAGRNSTHDITKGQMRVSTFFASKVSDPESNRIMMSTSIIGALFGGIHLIGWNFVFPSRTETILWRVSSALITGIPASAFIYSSMDLLEESSNSVVVKTFASAGGLLSMMVLFLGVPVYVLARVSLLTEAFIALRNLPPGAYALVKWTSFLPHL